MTRYLVIYEAPVSAQQQFADATPEQTQAGMDAWIAWAERPAMHTACTVGVAELCHRHHMARRPRASGNGSSFP